MLGDVVDVAGYVLAQPRRCNPALLVAAGFAVSGYSFEWELSVDHQRRLVRQIDHAVGPGVVGERELELETTHGQAVLHDCFHAGLAEGAAHLLVGEHVAQRGDL